MYLYQRNRRAGGRRSPWSRAGRGARPDRQTRIGISRISQFLSFFRDWDVGDLGWDLNEWDGVEI